MNYSTNRKFFFGYYLDQTKIVPCIWVEHDNVCIGPRLKFVQKTEITEKEADKEIDYLKLKYPLEQSG